MDGKVAAVLIIALLLTGGIAYMWYGLGFRFPFALTGFQAAQFNGAKTSFSYTKAYNCNNALGSGWFGYAEPNPGSTYYGGAGCTQSVTSSPVTVSSSQSFTATTGTFGSDSNDNAYGQVAGANCVLNNVLSNWCAHYSYYIASMGISGTMSYPYNSIDSNFQTLYGEPPPSAFPFLVGNDTQNNYYIWEYGFAIRLQVVGDVGTPTPYCLNGIGASRCQLAEQAAATQAFSFINQNDGISGTVGVDLTVPNSLVTSPTDKVILLGAWTSAQGCKQISTPQYGGVISVQQCSTHTIIPATNLVYSPFTYQSVSQYTLNQAQNVVKTVGQSQTSITLQITVNNMQVKYNSQCSQGTPPSATPCTNNGSITGGDPIVQADMTPGNLQLDVPIIFDVLQATPNKLGSGNGVCGGVITNCPVVTSNLGGIQVHVVDAFTTFPIAGVQVNVNPSTGGGCSASGNSRTSDNNGNVLFPGLGAGTYTVCASGSSGTANILFISWGVTYSPNTNQVSVVAGQVSYVSLPLQSNVAIGLTLFAVALLVLIIIIVAVFVAVFGRESVTSAIEDGFDKVRSILSRGGGG